MQTSARSLLFVALGVGVLAGAFLLFLPSPAVEGLPPPRSVEREGPFETDRPAEYPAIQGGVEKPMDAGERKPVASRPAPKPTSEATEKTTLVGKVQDSSGRPLAGVRVQLTEMGRGGAFSIEDRKGAEKKPLATAESGADGAFSIPEVPASMFHEKDNRPWYRLDLSLKGFGPLRKITMGLAGQMDLGTFVLYREAGISGRILAPRGRILEGPVVAARQVGADPFQPFSGIESQAQADGRYVVSGLSPGKWRLQVGAKGLRGAVSPEIQLVEGEQRGGVDFFLQEGLMIAGRISAADGRPIAGAEVFLTRIFRDFHEMEVGHEGVGFAMPAGGDGKVVSDPQGRYVASGLEPGEYSLRVKASGYAEASRSQVMPGPEPVDFVLGDRGWATGKVVDAESGNPVSGCGVLASKKTGEGLVLALPSSKPAEAVSGADGSFRLENLEPGRYDFTFLRKGFASRSEEDVLITSAQEVFLGTIALTHGATLRVQVVRAASNQGIQGATAALVAPDDEASWGRGRRRVVMVGGPRQEKSGESKTTDEGGWAIFSNLSPGSFLVRATHPEMAPGSTAALLREGETTEVAVPLSSGASLCGVAYSTEGLPLSGVTIALEPREGTAQRTQSRSEGQYCFQHLAPGEYWVRIEEGESLDFVVMKSYRGEEKEGVPVTLNEGDRLQLELREVPKGYLSGAVTQAGKPVPGAFVRISEQGSLVLPFFFMGTEGAKKTDEAGIFRIDRIKPGSYTVSASRPGAAFPAEASAEIRPGANTLDISLPGGRIEGRVLDAKTGKPVPGAKVKLERGGAEGQSKSVFAVTISADGEGGMGSMMTHEGGPGEPAKTDPEGRFQLWDLPAGKFRLQVKGASGYADAEIRDLVLEEGARKEGIEVRLEPGGGIRGRVLDAGGKPVGFAFLYLAKPSGENVRIATSGVDGAFKLEGIPAGDYTLRASGQDGGDAEIDCSVKPGQILERDLNLLSK